MYLHTCQARGLGKICGQRTTQDKVLEKVQNFEKLEDFAEHARNSYSNQCFRGLGVLYEYIIHGLQRRRTFSTFSKSNTLDHAGHFERQLCSRLFIKFCHKNCHNFLFLLQIFMRHVVNGDCYQNFMHAKREVWEKSVARERVASRFQKKFKILKKLKILKKIHGILIRTNAFVAWACCTNT